MAEPLRLASGRDSRLPRRAAKLGVGGRGLGTWPAEPPLTPPSCSMDGAGLRQAQEEGKPGGVHRESPTIAGQSLQLRDKSLEPMEGNRGVRLGWKKQLCTGVRGGLGKRALNLRGGARGEGVRASSAWGRQGDGLWVPWGHQVHVRAGTYAIKGLGTASPPPHAHLPVKHTGHLKVPPMPSKLCSMR